MVQRGCLHFHNFNAGCIWVSINREWLSDLEFLLFQLAFSEHRDCLSFHVVVGVRLAQKLIVVTNRAKDERYFASDNTCTPFQPCHIEIDNDKILASSEVQISRNLSILIFS